MQMLKMINEAIDRFEIGKMLDRVLFHIVGNAAGYDSFGEFSSPQGVTCEYWGDWKNCGSCFNGYCSNNQGQIRYKYSVDSYECSCGGWPFCCGCKNGTQIPGVYECRCCQ